MKETNRVAGSGKTAIPISEKYMLTIKRGVRIFQHWNQKHEENGGAEHWSLCHLFRKPLSDCP